MATLKAQETVNTGWRKEHKGLDMQLNGGYSFGLGDASGYNMMNLDVTVGKRLDNMFFGLGTGIWTNTESGSDAIIPILFGYEVLWSNRRVSPFTMLRMGFGINTAKDIKIGKETFKQPNYLLTQVMPGVRFGLSRSIDLDLGVGLIGMTSVGGSKGAGGRTSVYMSVGGALSFNKSNRPRKPKVPTRDKGMQITLEGGKLGFGSGDDKYSGITASLAVTYKFNHNLSAGIGAGLDGTEPEIAGGISFLKISDGTVKGRDTRYMSFSIPPKVFVRGMYNFTSKRFSPFVACDAGVRFYSFDKDYGYNNYGNEIESLIGSLPSTGFYIEPSVGISVRTTNNSYLDLKAGYALSPAISGKTAERFDGDSYSAASRAALNTSAPFVSIGFRHTFRWMSK